MRHCKEKTEYLGNKENLQSDLFKTRRICSAFTTAQTDVLKTSAEPILFSSYSKVSEQGYEKEDNLLHSSAIGQHSVPKAQLEIINLSRFNPDQISTVSVCHKLVFSTNNNVNTSKNYMKINR